MRTWMWILSLAGIAVGGYLIYNKMDPLIRLTGPMGMAIWKRQSQVTPQELQFERQVDAGLIRT